MQKRMKQGGASPDGRQIARQNLVRAALDALVPGSLLGDEHGRQGCPPPHTVVVLQILIVLLPLLHLIAGFLLADQPEVRDDSRG